MTHEQHNAWHIAAYRQAGYRPFLPFVAVARKSIGNKQATWYNAEGNSEAEAIANVKRICDKADLELQEG